MPATTPADLDALRDLYRPADDLTLSREVRALIALGLTGPDVAATMRIPVLEVSRLLDQPAEL